MAWSPGLVLSLRSRLAGFFSLGDSTSLQGVLLICSLKAIAHLSVPPLAPATELTPKALASRVRIFPLAPSIHEIIQTGPPSQPLLLGKDDSQSLHCRPHLPNMNDILEALCILDKLCLHLKCE